MTITEDNNNIGNNHSCRLLVSYLFLTFNFQLSPSYNCICQHNEKCINLYEQNNESEHDDDWIQLTHVVKKNTDSSEIEL
jgi:hypothetical protein